MPSVYNEARAFAELKYRPLTFGDANQIAAVRFIEQVDQCEESLRTCQCIRDCDGCGGEGVHECHACHNETKCAVCDGTGFEGQCPHTQGFSEEVIAAARKRIER
jgi:hypothetical protein